MVRTRNSIVRVLILLRADLGEEELLLDALSVCGPALACLGTLLAPAALLALGLLPEEVSLEARRPPYLLRLTLHKVGGAHSCDHAR